MISGAERHRLQSYATELGYQEGLWSNEDGFATEFGARALLWIADMAWHRPHDDLFATWNPAVEIIARSVNAHQSKVTPSDLRDADAVFAISSNGTFATVSQLDDDFLPQKPEWPPLVEGFLQDLLFSTRSV